MTDSKITCTHCDGTKECACEKCRHTEVIACPIKCHSVEKTECKICFGTGKIWGCPFCKKEVNLWAPFCQNCGKSFWEEDIKKVEYSGGS
jgi:hypothetical protein|tara:strand:- start:1163 stop:1432 length:270 start_codon:yes stop_codon:yes gene_type:complete